VTPDPDAEAVANGGELVGGAVRAVSFPTAKWRYGHEHIQRQPNDASEDVSEA